MLLVLRENSITFDIVSIEEMYLYKTQVIFLNILLIGKGKLMFRTLKIIGGYKKVVFIVILSLIFFISSLIMLYIHFGNYNLPKDGHLALVIYSSFFMGTSIILSSILSIYLVVKLLKGEYAKKVVINLKIFILIYIVYTIMMMSCFIYFYNYRM